jgi:hypothetical protein
MKRLPPIFFFLLAGFLTACPARPQAIRLPAAPPATIPVTNAAGEVLSRQEGPLWVLISGVDEHGLPEAHEVELLAAPAPEAAARHQVHSGAPAAVHEIRQAGPQNLWRFYLVRATDGRSGWVSDYFVRRQAYLFSAETETIPIHDAPAGATVYQAGQVTPVVLLEPTRADWWLVATAHGAARGWLATGTVKESPVWECLLDIEHDHGH